MGCARLLKGTRFGEEPSDSFIDGRDSSDIGTVEHCRQAVEAVNAHNQWRVPPVIYIRMPKSSCWTIRQPKPTHPYFVHDHVASGGTDVTSRKRKLTKSLLQAGQDEGPNKHDWVPVIRIQTATSNQHPARIK